MESYLILLPSDVIIEIIVRIRERDIRAFKQTCRSIREAFRTGGVNLKGEWYKRRYGDGAFERALQFGDLGLVKSLVETQGMDVNCRLGRQHQPLLHRAVDWAHWTGNDFSIVKYLLRRPDIDVNARGSYGRTILHRLNGGRGSECALKRLLKIPRLDVNAADAFGITPLVSAVGVDEDAVKTLHLLGRRDIRLDISEQRLRHRSKRLWPVASLIEQYIKVGFERSTRITNCVP